MESIPSDIRRLIRIVEAKVPDGLAKPVASLRRHGWRLVNHGLGTSGAVMRRADKPFLIKLFLREDRAYEAFVRLAQQHPNPHFPQFTGDILTATSLYNVIRVEPLKPNWSPAMAKFCHWTESYMTSRADPQPEAIEYVVQSPHLKEACDLIADHLLGKFNLDLETKNNVMLRGSTFVFSDPVAAALSP